MRFIKKQFSMRRIVVMIGVAAIAIPIAARVNPTVKAVVSEREEHLVRQTASDNEGTAAKYSKDSKAAVNPGIERPQDYYDRRREYWEKRVERRLDYREEYLEKETGDDKDDADAKDSKDKKDSKAGKDAAGDEDDAVDKDMKSEQELIDRRREYWRDRVEREW